MSVCAFAEFYENVDLANFVIYNESIDIKEYLRQEREYEKDRNKNDLHNAFCGYVYTNDERNHKRAAKVYKKLKRFG